MATQTLTRATRIRNPALFICDIQEKFRHVIHEFPRIITTTTKLLRATGTAPLNTPIYITTQNKSKLGDTVPELHAYLYPETNAQTGTSPRVLANIDKTLFSMITPELAKLLPDPNAGETPLDAIIVGIETHICVTQTTLDLLSRGHRVYVVVDGVSSVHAEERGVALARLRDAGAIVTTSESLLFEMVGDARHEAFRGVSGVVKEMKEETRGALEALARI
ncbi:putative isochorismatase family hydrolase [Aspergillus homomorphus CBS 101889]|uniref:Isochorismatase domain-containing protein n=1 Tax=Aspergillus homomorphus (strain CBS 101889) TaxID=1450537 RepID=A0A395I7K8_ASPHC|nr:isochorismatase domain-containing protein [Aspergillus homomorphus CBS 101889]RAL15243.1 isochorismatase domain-containing protein [Aspergillus homomorphus CBS 101889]